MSQVQIIMFPIGTVLLNVGLAFSEVEVATCCCRARDTRQHRFQFLTPGDEESVVKGVDDIALKLTHHLHIGANVNVITVDKSDLTIDNCELRVEGSQGCNMIVLLLEEVWNLSTIRSRSILSSFSCGIPIFAHVDGFLSYRG